MAHTESVSRTQEQDHRTVRESSFLGCKSSSHQSPLGSRLSELRGSCSERAQGGGVKYYAYVIKVITRTGGMVFDIYKVDAVTGSEAVAIIAEACKVVPETQLYLISEQEADEWAAMEIPIKEVPKFFAPNTANKWRIQ
jgi:hypothetical protein